MIRAFVGPMGSGKTLSMVWAGCKDLLEGRKVFTNTPFHTTKNSFKSKVDYITGKGSHVELRPIFLQDEEFLDAMREENNAVFCVDEANVVFSNREWKNLDMKFIHRFSHSRKLANDIYYTSQRFKHTEVRLRDLTNDVVECQFGHLFNFPIFPLYLKQTIYLPDKFDYQFFNEELTDKFIIGINYIWGKDLKTLFNSYDTKFEIKFSASKGKLYEEKIKSTDYQYFYNKYKPKNNFNKIILPSLNA